MHSDRLLLRKASRGCKESLRRIYEAHKDEFESFVAFIHARAGKSQFAREMRKKIGEPHSSADADAAGR